MHTSEPQGQSLAFVRTGLLHVPSMDTAAGEAVSNKLRGASFRAFIQQESYAASDRRWLEDTLCKWCDEEELDLLLTIGGTLPAPGPSNREIVPEATAAVVERAVPGLAEAMRAYMREEFPGVSLHRGMVGIRGRTLIVNLPAGAEVAALFLEAILEDLPYLLAHLRSDDKATTLAEIVNEGVVAPGESTLHEDTHEAEEVPPPKPKGKGLDADEFAAFLRRGKSGDV